jgi:hypothetical protein
MGIKALLSFLDRMAESTVPSPQSKKPQNG